MALREAGRIIISEFEKLERSLKGSAEGNQSVRDFIIQLERGSASERIAALERTKAQTSATFELSGDLSRSEQATRIKQDFNDRINLYRQLRREGLLTEDQLSAASGEALTKRIHETAVLKHTLTEIQNLELKAAHMFAAGFSQAFVDFVSGTKSAGEAFREFASQFLNSVAQMLMEAAVFKIVKGMFGLSGGGSVSAGGGDATGDAFGGVHFAANGLAGVASVSRPTFFPKFNVVAGEAGREMLTVLAQPRMMSVGGMQAVVGNAGSNRLAITSADALAGAGMSGRAVIEIQVAAGSEARIIENSISGAVIRVTQDMGRHTALREATRKA